MANQTDEVLNRWAAELLGWEQSPWPEGWDAEGQEEEWFRVDEKGERKWDLPDFIHDLGACEPLLKRLGYRARFYWAPGHKTWVCRIVSGCPFRLFASPQSEPGRCIILAAQYVFGKERDD